MLRPWQRQLIYRIFARRPDGRRRHRIAYVGMPRKNGKSALASSIALDGLLFDVQGAEVYSAASDKDQARIVFAETKRMIAGSPELREVCNPMRDVIDVPSTGSVYRVLSSEAFTKEGLNPTRNIIDELHAHPTDELFNVLVQGTGARLEPMTIIITTAGVMTDQTGGDSIAYRLFRHGVDVASGAEADDSFFFAWWGAPQDADHRDRDTWQRANPGFSDIVSEEDIAAACKLFLEPEFRTKRLNQWVSTMSAWFPAGVFEGAAAPRDVGPDEPVVLGFDGSYNGDCTALVSCTVGDAPYIDVVGFWQRPAGAGDDWTVPIMDVEERIRQVCRERRVKRIVADPYRWSRSLEGLADERLPVLEFPQAPQRMMPACARFYEGICNQTVSHSGDPDLVQHVANAVLKTDARGSRITKDTKGSPRKIDLAVAAVMAVDQAAQESSFGPRVINLNDYLETP